MKFRPCIDIHNGKVKQIVGGSLNDTTGAKENFVATLDADYYANMYKDKDLRGGHIILLNKSGTDEYEATKKQAILALRTFPGGMQIGGGITAQNAKEFIDAGASHVVVTSYIFDGPKLNMDKLNALVDAVGKEHVVLDLSCRSLNGEYYVVTDRWQTFTDLKVNEDILNDLSKYCDEFLIHGVDVEGMKQGIDDKLLTILGNIEGIKITYAGGVRNMSDIDRIEQLGRGRVDFTIGSALNLFGGDMDFEEVINRVG